MRLKKKEQIPTSQINSSLGSMYGENPEGTSSSTTTQTTTYQGNNPSKYSTSSKNEESTFRLTIPVTLTLFAVIDCVGFLSGNNNNPRDTNKNFIEFFKQSTPSLPKADSQFLNQIFRQGLTHVYFPKLGVGISYHSKNPSGKLFFRNGEGVLILNVNALEELVMKTFLSVKENESLYTQMETRYQHLISGYETAYGAKIKDYPT